MVAPPRQPVGIALAVLLGALVSLAPAQTPDAAAIVKGAIDYWRGAGSYALMAMTVHRPTFDRQSVIQAFTRGPDDARVRLVEPVKDAGDSTLNRGDDIWVFTPRLNRVVKIPFSLARARA